MTKGEEQKFRKLQIRIEELEKDRDKSLQIYGKLLTEIVDKNMAIRYAKECLAEATAELQKVGFELG